MFKPTFPANLLSGCPPYTGFHFRPQTSMECQLVPTDTRPRSLLTAALPLPVPPVVTSTLLLPSNCVIVSQPIQRNSSGSWVGKLYFPS